MTKQEHWISGGGYVYNVDRWILQREEEVISDYVYLFITAHPKWLSSQLTKIFKGVTAKFFLKFFRN